jgi:magnesium transporter
MAADERGASSRPLRGLLSRTPPLVRGLGGLRPDRDSAEATGSQRSLDDVVVDCGLYENGHRQPDTTSVSDALQRANASSDGFVWIGLNAPTHQEFAGIAELFELPELAVEDAIRAHQRPKLEQYGAITFVVMKPVRYVDHDEVVEVSELALFLGKHFVVTVRHGESTVPSAVRAELDQNADILRHGPGVVLYRVADLVVDGYAEVIEAVSDDIDDIEVRVFSGDRTDHAERIYKLKREVLEFRRAVAPLADPMQRLAEGRVPGVAKDAQPYFRDVYDHVLRASDAIETYDKLLSDVLAADLAQVAVRQSEVTVRQNEDMRKISAWAAIALVPTAIAGIYGMKFDFMPELRWRFGYFLVLAVILTICIVLYRSFRRNGWL